MLTKTKQNKKPKPKQRQQRKYQNVLVRASVAASIHSMGTAQWREPAPHVVPALHLCTMVCALVYVCVCVCVCVHMHAHLHAHTQNVIKH